ncbi:hypothetical protein RHMOL_Rhmol11G0182800 [Rhododendron molle]|uniref:Uncharacterized protein n=1 Tax=Rhododendron molle TaxID=49168 RepID=A0ACC0LTK9_RHOML|nr:hypothetical protein RHMOL_Rhmol11G0182800 [Rhododendron molle]
MWEMALHESTSPSSSAAAMVHVLNFVWDQMDMRIVLNRSRKLAFEIAALSNLKVFDLESTETMHLPTEIRELTSLRCFRVSLCARANHYCSVTKQKILKN